MHSCVNCGQACYCHGDIDDCEVETLEYAAENCTGCNAGDCSDEPLDGVFITPYDDRRSNWTDDQATIERAGQLRLLP